MNPPQQFETERLILRKPRRDDAPAIFRGWTQDPEVTRFLSWRPHQRLEQTETFVRNCLAAWEDEARFPYLITTREGQRAVGVIDPRLDGWRMEIGYMLARPHWGRGYMTEAVLTIIAWAFRQPTIYRVYATTDVENLASQRVLEKSGMQREGILRKYALHPNVSEEPRDSYMYAIVK